MKVRELIEALSKCDLDAVVDLPHSEGLYFVEQLPGYYDGYWQELIHDEDLKGKCYSVKGMKYSRAATKVSFHVITVEGILQDCNSKEQVDNVMFEYDTSLHASTIQNLKDKNENLKTARKQEILDESKVKTS